MSRSSKSRFARSRAGDLFVWFLLLVLGVFMLLPLVYTTVSAFKPFNEIFLFPPRFFVRRPTTDNFAGLFALAANMWVPFSRYVFNSVFVSVVATGLHVLLSSAAAYPLAKDSFPGRQFLGALIVATLLFNSTVTALPQYILLTKLRWVNTYLALIAPFIGSTLGLFLMRQFMEQMIPDAILEAARIDGACEYRTLFSVVLPNVKPAWMTLIIFCFQNVWANTGASVIYDEQLKTLPAALSQISTAGLARMGEGMAASLLLILPPIAVFIVSQNRIVETMAFAGLKD